ncbi:hypothetical protein MMC07_007741 [Pseudocyphellaria aurata]|nr:hypothetical protein [Pseudocyphellaria aurata]
MKLSLAVTFAFMATTLAIPSMFQNVSPLEPRGPVGTSCKVVRRLLPDLNGVCVDANSCSSCKNGQLYTANLCPGGCNILCCIN